MAWSVSSSDPGLAQGRPRLGLKKDSQRQPKAALSPKVQANLRPSLRRALGQALEDLGRAPSDISTLAGQRCICRPSWH